MAHSLTANTSCSAPSPSPVCQTRTDILDRLATILKNLGVAKVELWSCIEFGDHEPCESVRLEVERLRGDCNSLRLELESHRTRHGC